MFRSKKQNYPGLYGNWYKIDEEEIKKVENEYKNSSKKNKACLQTEVINDGETVQRQSKNQNSKQMGNGSDSNFSERKNTFEDDETLEELDNLIKNLKEKTKEKELPSDQQTAANEEFDPEGKPSKSEDTSVSYQDTHVVSEYNSKNKQEKFNASELANIESIILGNEDDNLDSKYKEILSLEKKLVSLVQSLPENEKEKIKNTLDFQTLLKILKYENY